MRQSDKNNLLGKILNQRKKSAFFESGKTIKRFAT
jgi:hypothetical protein